MKASLQQISEATGFSTATVSNALNHKRGVNAETASRILEAARRLGYFSTAKINAVRFVQYKSSGLVAADTPFFASLSKGIEQECRTLGIEAILTVISRSDPDFDTLLEQVLGDVSCGVVLLATEATEEDMELFSRAQAPLLLLDNWPESACASALLISNTDSACHAVEYLIEKGHREIGYLKSSVRIKNFFYRQEGYRRAFALHGLDAREEFEVPLPPETSQAWHAMSRWLEEKPRLPTAFFADNDNIALGALKAFAEHGIRVPQDVSIIGFDDMPFAEFSTPPLTTVQVEKEEMGRLAVRILTDRARAGLSSATKTQICTRLVERDSVCPPVLTQKEETT